MRDRERQGVKVLDIIGRTRIIPLRHVVPEKSARILVTANRERHPASKQFRKSR